MANNSLHIGFTICSNNYLGQANALKSSFVKNNREFSFYFIVVDKPSSEIDYENFLPGTVLFIEDIPTIDVSALVDKYDIIEFNTAVKPSIFKYLIAKNKKLKSIYYLDPDLFFYSSLDRCNVILQTASMVLTPHILNPIVRDAHSPTENTFLNFGIYNLGFIGLNPNHDDAIKMLDWWEERTINHGYNNTAKGYFVDQLWMNLAPLFFEDVVVLKEYGYNMGPWNLQERKVKSINGDEVFLNDGSRLVFYHFSKISDNHNEISREYNRYKVSDFPLLKDLYDGYKEMLSISNFDSYRHIKVAYNLSSWREKDSEKRFIFKRGLRKLGKILIRKTE